MTLKQGLIHFPGNDVSTVMTITDTLSALISQALQELHLTVPAEIHIEHPADTQHGDYSSNVALLFFGKKTETHSAYKNPRQLAQAISDQIKKEKEKMISHGVLDISVAGPGFINFTLSRKFLLNQLTKIIQSSKKDTTNISTQRVMVEFTDPNPFKELHIGHLYSNTVGESICRLLEAHGIRVQRVCYQGDVGMHVAKSVWGMRQKLQQDNEKIENIARKSLSERMRFLGQSYALGATEFEKKSDTPTPAQEEMKQINYLTFLSAQDELVAKGWQPQVDYKQYLQTCTLPYEEIRELYRLGRAWSLEYFETIYTRVGMAFDDYYFESLVGEYGVKIVQEFLLKGVFERSQGAIIFPGSKYGLHDRVFINSLGLPTYECKELGLAPEKYRRFPYDQSIIITGNEIDEYFKVLLTALQQIRPDLAAKTRHISHGMVRLPEGKMSSRTGKVLTAEWLIDEAKKRVLAIFDETGTVLSPEEKDDVAEKVGLAAIKYTYLKTNIGKDIAFSFKESLSFQGNSGPYLQYTYARCQSVLRKSGEEVSQTISDIKPNVEEQGILQTLYQLDEVVSRAVYELAPHYICTYLFDLAQAYNAFYNKHQILEASAEIRALRLQLTQATAMQLQKGLHLLGIQTVEKM